MYANQDISQDKITDNQLCGVTNKHIQSLSL
jgi:hypothetical protein